MRRVEDITEALWGDASVAGDGLGSQPEDLRKGELRMIVLKRSRAGEVRNVTAANQGVFERADAAQRRIK
jgi:hypothetical protein